MDIKWLRKTISGSEGLDVSNPIGFFTHDTHSNILRKHRNS